MPPNLVNVGPETAEISWRVFAHPLNVRIASLTTRTLYNRQQAKSMAKVKPACWLFLICLHH